MNNTQNKIISHRGNLNGPDPNKENKLEQITKVLETTNFDVEIDVWKIDDNLYLGHDFSEELIDINFLLTNQKRLWIHCKNIDPYLEFAKYRSFGRFSLNFFFHDQDDCALTSCGWLWGFPNETLDEKIQGHYIHVVLNESLSYDVEQRSSYKNICTDYPLSYE